MKYDILALKILLWAVFIFNAYAIFAFSFIVAAILGTLSVKYKWKIADYF